MDGLSQLTVAPFGSTPAPTLNLTSTPYLQLSAYASTGYVSEVETRSAASLAISDSSGRVTIKERRVNGLNLYAMLDNNPLSYIDLLGLEKRDCNWAIYHSHGTQKRDDPDNNTQKSINESSPQKCDKLGFSGCHRKSMNQFIEDKHPGKVLPSAERQNDQETLVNGKKPFEDNRNPGDKLPQDGLELIKILEKTKIDAKTEIAKPESCCKSITIHIVCPSPDFQKWYSKEKVGEDGPYCGKTYTIK